MDLALIDQAGAAAQHQPGQPALHHPACLIFQQPARTQHHPRQPAGNAARIADHTGPAEADTIGATDDRPGRVVLQRAAGHAHADPLQANPARNAPFDKPLADQDPARSQHHPFQIAGQRPTQSIINGAGPGQFEPHPTAAPLASVSSATSVALVAMVQFED
ncbi:hypothetical protein GT370_08055 [Acidocella sp. MX-AZ03]|uniref:hypothetical protein n=1 Tax=Acidocella sp. MX-AZ03 TaxID=2697363 RepID=UPI0022DE6A97|nr:hypothetical protein [Acidocella sp. MX-AZ03]WBO60703.1 hypothetical protein GT370_08055 [Acidocella sp. MX-AZ03]